MDDDLFDQAAEALRSMAPAELGDLHVRPRRWGLKVWFGAAEPTREHYEAQVLGARHLPEGATLGIEIGFHAEHRDLADNDASLARITTAGPRWRKELGGEAEAGPFIGAEDRWRRISEVWIDPDLGDPDLPWEVGARLCDYVTVLEPLRATVRS